MSYGDLKIRVRKKVPMLPSVPRGINKGRPAKYPWATMDVGDSFAFPLDIGRGAYAAAINASKDGKKFKAVRDGVRYYCWRIA